MRFFKREKEEPSQVRCLNCGELMAPVDAIVCDMCGWDQRELPPKARAGLQRSDSLR